MLSKEQNEILYKAGPGTPMGELFRRFWTPIGAAAELDDTPTKPLTIMNEELVLYKDASGHYGLIERHCPHRRADMSYGWVEECGIRCDVPEVRSSLARCSDARVSSTQAALASASLYSLRICSPPLASHSRTSPS